MSSCEIPDKPCVYGTEQQIAFFSQFSCPFYMVQHPADFCCGEVCVQQKPCFFPEQVSVAFFRQFFAVLGCPTALPYNGVVNGLACALVPENGGFSLVGDANGGNVSGSEPFLFQGFLCHFQLALPDFHGVVFHPAGLGINLTIFLLSSADSCAIFVKEDTAGAGGSLIQRHDILHTNPPFHGKSPERGLLVCKK